MPLLDNVGGLQATKKFSEVRKNPMNESQFRV
jgi:hypothetical protein